MRAWALGIIGWLVLRLLAWTWRVRTEEPEDLKEALRLKKTLVFAHWHRDELALLSISARYRICSLVSTSQDGRMMAIILKLFGVRTAPGSSTRGGVSGYLSLIRLIKKSHRNGSFAVDGPRGPIYQAKPGVIKLAEHLKAPIFYPGVAVSRAWDFPKSWNQAYLPKPFSKILISWHKWSYAQTDEKLESPSAGEALTLQAHELSEKMKQAQRGAQKHLSKM